MSDKLTWKRRVARAWRIAARHPSERRVILNYHSVDGGPLSTPRAAFEAQMAWLADHAFLSTFEAMLDGSAVAGLTVAVTFDDGYQSVARVAAPIMRRAGLAGIVYVNTSFIADASPRDSDSRQGHYPGETFMLWSELLDLRATGWLVGSHGTEHQDLTRLASREADVQLRDSKAMIEQRLSVDCLDLAYPWGYHNRAVRRLAAACGYRSAVAGVHGPLTSDSDRYAIPRIDVRRDFSLDDFAAVVRGDWDYLGHLQSARHFVHRWGDTA